MADLTGQIAVVTGANSGVGRSATELLCRAGARVIMVCRSRERGQRALDEIQSGAPGASVRLEVADLVEQALVRRLGERLADELDRVDILVNNAGVWRHKRESSPDGFEVTFATNHLAHFLLAHLLLEHLRTGRGHIVNVSSEAHRQGDLRRAAIETIARGDAWASGLQAYSDSKLANVLFTTELARRYGDQGVTAVSLHPGVLSTRIWNQNSGPISLLMRLFKPLMSGPDVGGRAVLRLAEDPGRDREVSGTYYKVEKRVDTAPQAQDDELAKELWDLSAAWIGLGVR
ncbi:MAG: SDR family NAD(P)-dependent oxidoreductase [Gemmatimonadetes bacterium]|nr:SDR family NAD(P)-dependent oxidoreductase [Gemmatimonadota bacterium]